MRLKETRCAGVERNAQLYGTPRRGLSIRYDYKRKSSMHHLYELDARGISALKGLSNTSSSGASAWTITSSHFEHLWFHNCQALGTGSRCLHFSLPCRTFSGNITWWIASPVISASCHSFFVCGRREHWRDWTYWRGNPVEQIRIGANAISPAPVRRRRIGELWSIFVPVLRCLCDSGKTVHNWICSDFIIRYVHLDWHRRYERFFMLAGQSGDPSNMRM